MNVNGEYLTVIEYKALIFLKEWAPESRFQTCVFPVKQGT